MEGRPISLAPLLQAPLAIQIHAFAALAAFLLGVVQIVRLKGTRTHRVIGYTWIGLMLFVALSSFFIHELRLWGNLSPIHLLSIFTLAMLPLGIYFARHHNVAGQRKRWDYSLARSSLPGPLRCCRAASSGA